MATIKEQYNKERRRIQRQIRSMEKRGYKFDKNMLPPRPKQIKSGSVRRLQKITAESLYRAAQYEIEPGRLVSGMVGRGAERRAAAQKAAATRAGRAWEYHDDELIKEGEIVYKRIQDLIQTHRSMGHDAAADYIEAALSKEFNTYGRDATLSAMARNGDEIIDELDMSLYYRPGSPQLTGHLTNVTILIRSGEVPDAATMRDIQRAADNDTVPVDFEPGEMPDEFYE